MIRNRITTWALLAALTAWALMLASPPTLAAATSPPVESSLEQLAPGLHRYNFRYKAFGLMPFPIATFLLSSERHDESDAPSDWLLVDAGCANESSGAWATALTEAVAEAVGAGTLHGILVTHSHPDHVGALHQLLQRFPDAKVIAHRAEHPFLVEGKKFSILQGDTLLFNVMKYAPRPWTVTVPEERAIFLSGSGGELADVAGKLGGGAGSGLRQLLGAWRWLHVPGHSPGMVALHRKADNTVIAADAFFKPKLPWQSNATLGGPPAFLSSNYTQVIQSMNKLAELGFSRLYPSHDNAAGVSLEEVRAVLASKAYSLGSGEEL